MSDRFYTPDPLGPGEYVLTGPEAHHLTTVRRLAAGARITLFNGDGCDYPAEIASLDRKSAILHLLEPIIVNRELPFALVVAAALPKGDRADFLIEKLTEFGTSRFIPLLTNRSVVVPKANVVEKFTRAAIESSKQCGRNRLMAVEPPRKWSEFVSRSDLPPARFVLHLGHVAKPEWPIGGDVVVAVGPEGGFAEAEIEEASAAGWRCVTLGSRVLRVETAAIAAAALLALRSPQ